MPMRPLALVPAVLMSVGFSAAFAADPAAARYYEDALGRYDQGDLAGAVVQLKNVLKADPQMLAAHVLLGRALLASGDAIGAQVELEQALKLGVSRGEVVVALGEAYLRQGKYQLLLDSLTVDGLPAPIRTDLLVLRASALAEAGKVLEAGRELEEARRLSPGSAPVLMAQATLAIRAGDLARATPLVDQAMALAPADPVVWNLHASVLHLQGDLAGALAAYAKAASLKPRYLDPRVARAGLLVDLQRMEEAERDLEEALAIQPREPRAHYLRAVIAQSRGDKARAKESLNEVTRLLDPVPSAVLALHRQMQLLAGLAHYELGNQEKAVDYLSAYLKQHPGEPGPTKVLASLFLDRGDRARAMSLLEPLLRSAPNDPRGLSLLAAGYMQEGDYRRASELLDKAVQTSGEADIRTDLGLSLVGAGKARMGIEELRKAFEKDPRQLRPGIALATLYLRGGQPRQALEVLDTVVRRDPGNLAALNLQGIARGAAGDRTGARRAYEQVLARDAGYQGASLNLVRLDTAEGRFDQARERLARMLKADGWNIDAMEEMAVTEDRAGNLAEAVRWLEKGRADPRGAVRLGMRLAELHLRNGSAEEALAVAKDVAFKAADDLAALALLARAQLARGDAAGARQTLADMTRYANYRPQAQLAIARLQVMAGNDSGAAYSLDKALSSQPDFLPALVMLAEIDIRKREFPRAEQRIRQVGEKHPTSSAALRLQGDLALARGQHQAALAAYAAALKKDDSAEMALRLFAAHMGAGEMARGVALLEKWLRGRADNGPVLRTVADGHLHLGNLAAARSAYERLLKLQPDDPHVLNNLAQAALKQNDQAAAGFAERAWGLRPNDPIILDTLGWIHVRQGSLDRGVALLREARLRDSTSAEIRFHLASALARSGRRAEAKEELAFALRSGAAFEGIEEARRLNAELGK